MSTMVERYELCGVPSEAEMVDGGWQKSYFHELLARASAATHDQEKDSRGRRRGARKHERWKKKAVTLLLARASTAVRDEEEDS